jgi:hypothetical protein
LLTSKGEGAFLLAGDGGAGAGEMDTGVRDHAFGELGGGQLFAGQGRN